MDKPTFQKYNESPKRDSFSWADLNFSTLYKIIDARAYNYEQFKSLITGLECALTYFAEKDQEYLTAMATLEQKKTEMTQEIFPENIEAFYWDEKFKILSSLVGRINLGKIKLSQYVNESTIVKDIAGKLASGIGQNVFFTGKQGTGKTESAVKFMKEVLKENNMILDVEKSITTTPETFTQRYNSKDLVECQGLMFDDCGVSYNARDWQKDSNKLFSKLLQVIRHRALLVCFTSPDLSYIDSQGRKILHWWFETDKLNKKTGICTIKPHVVEVVQMTGKILYPFPIYDEKQITSLKVTALDSETRNKVVEMGKSFKDDLGIKTEMELSLSRPKEKEAVRYVMYRRKGHTQKEIREKLMPMSTGKAVRLERQYKSIQ